MKFQMMSIPPETQNFCGVLGGGWGGGGGGVTLPIYTSYISFGQERMTSWFWVEGCNVCYFGKINSRPAPFKSSIFTENFSCIVL